jgi:hypothetical protein
MRDRRARDRMVVGFITTCAISAYHHYSYELEHRSWRGELDTTLPGLEPTISHTRAEDSKYYTTDAVTVF